MDAQNLATSWSVLGKSVRGVSHIRTNRPNQDALALHSNRRSGLPAIMVVSDGHGSPQYFRSDKGSRIAVHGTRHLLIQLSNAIHARNLSFLATCDLIQHSLRKIVTQFWIDQVKKDIEKNPFSVEELETLTYYQIDPGEAVCVYGATLLAVLITGQYFIYLQLGDGDILQVSKAGDTERAFPKDENLIANETHSLSEPEAWRNVRVSCQPYEVNSPALILVSTDGYSNSFASEEGFLKIGPDILNIIHRKGLSRINENLKSWLSQASEMGSGDDVTLGILSCIGQAEPSHITGRKVIDGAHPVEAEIVSL